MKEVHIFQKENKEENKILRKNSKEVDIKEINSDKIQKIIYDMWFFLDIQPDGVGLAAPQIGNNNRIFIISPRVYLEIDKNIPSKDDLTFINPKIIKTSKKKKYLEEGCFSVRWFYGQVNRSSNITIEYLNNKGQKRIIGASGLLSQIFQHEIDHLDGILFCDKAVNLIKLSDEKIKDIECEKQKMTLDRKNKKNSNKFTLD